MSTTVEINGLALLPIKEAAKRVSYSRDYVSRLAREGKIVASQIGRQWYVELESLKKYHADSKVVEAVQKQSLRAERKRELEAATLLKALQVETEAQIRRERTPAILSTLAVIMVGLLTGGMFYSFSLYFAPASVSPVAQVTLSQSATVPTPAVTTVLPAVTESRPTLLYSREDESGLSEEIIPLAEASGVLLLTRSRETNTPAAVAELFSDPVSVEFVGEASGVVRYERASGEIVEFPFVRVPGASSSLTE